MHSCFSGTPWIPVVAGATLLALTSSAAIRLPAVFSDNMVLQQEAPIRVWGWSDSEEDITVSFAGQQVSAAVEGGRWQARLEPARTTAPQAFQVSDSSNLMVLTNVLLGEVWVCSGQSNMEWPLEKAHEPGPDIVSATNRQIRFFAVPRIRADHPAEDVEARWVVCSPETVRGFSAVGYYFGRDLNRVLDAPVGLIGTYWGGTPAEAWTSGAMLESKARYRSEILQGYARALEDYQGALERYQEERQDAEAAGREFKKRAPREPWQPSSLYNGMIAPLQPFTIKGAIWYQGESNAGRAAHYRELFPDMIRCWRDAWQQGNFPFLCVQLAPFKVIQEMPGESDWAELREAQLHATEVLPNVGMAVITDVGDEKDIHPRKKEPVGARLALAARALSYGEPVTYSGPVYRRHEVRGDRILLTFDHTGRGLERRGDALTGFAICGEDRVWQWGTAEIEPNDTVVVWSEAISEPVAVRYGWADYPVVNLWNRDGLPASPFRTDNFPMITESR